jgi:hypothetical protein
MNTETITKRGIESALYVCPDTTVVTSRVVRERASDTPVTPFQGTGLPFAGTAAMADATVAVRTIQQQLVPSHPGDTARRPPA